MNGWISVRNWRRFQHYDPAKRQPPWIKTYTELMSDDAYLSLTEHRALLLHRLWLEYASSRCRLRLDVSSMRSRRGFDTASLGQRLGMRVTTADLDALINAGFIAIVASATLAEGYHDASARAHVVEVETETDVEEPEPTLDDTPLSLDNSTPTNNQDVARAPDMAPLTPVFEIVGTEEVLRGLGA